jgi:hypothetical protein
MKKNHSSRSFRGTLRGAMSLHEGRLRELLAELEGGARLGRWVQEMSNEFGAGVEVMRILVKEHNEKHPTRRVGVPEPRS